MIHFVQSSPLPANGHDIGRAARASLAALFGGVILALAGCVSAPSRSWAEQTTFLEMPAAEARQYAANWAAAEPTRRGWGYVGTTGSMEPNLKGGEIALLQKPVPRQVYTPGRIVIWLRGDDIGLGRPIHRVTAVQGNAIYIKGDGCVWADGWFSRGTVAWIVPTIIRIPRSQTR